MFFLLQQKALSLLQAANENLSPKVMRELAKEIKSLDAEPPEGIRIIVNEDNFANVQAEIDGPGRDSFFSCFDVKFVMVR